jgi:hypothetical protein
MLIFYNAAGVKDRLVMVGSLAGTPDQLNRQTKLKIKKAGSPYVLNNPVP